MIFFYIEVSLLLHRKITSIRKVFPISGVDILQEKNHQVHLHQSTLPRSISVSLLGMRGLSEVVRTCGRNEGWLLV